MRMRKALQLLFPSLQTGVLIVVVVVLFLFQVRIYRRDMQGNFYGILLIFWRGNLFSWRFRHGVSVFGFPFINLAC